MVVRVHKGNATAPWYEFALLAIAGGLFAVMVFYTLFSKDSVHSPDELHDAVITSLAESYGEPLEGRVSVLAVIVNRLGGSGGKWDTLSKVVRWSGCSKIGQHGVCLRRTWQFEPWQTRKREMLAYRTDPSQCGRNVACKKLARAYQEHMYLLKGLLSGVVSDPTKKLCPEGAFYFLNRRIVQKRTGTLPGWARGRPSLTIGHHTFLCKGGR